ncbi:LOW QUALITY PROTEIN: threonine/homoserine/homoserine lactone efflux protein [Rhizobium mongolense USDA 1844]|uniref:Threonine/homoserine/homoserine lactone efflux protein n=2 Tax=Rhizobium mongolense TaxID=57676 RepID=A0A559TDT0_9HYPH|nr:LOW QUALITY PROTEIN: threonine/homoserine/homoserine lactone efflux protein [Rhizobium mongolense USDA 1844]
MSEIATIFSILGVFLLGAMSPGPSFVVVSRIAVSGERTDGLAAALGMSVGGVHPASIAVAGLTALLMQVAWLDISLRLAGGAYLLWIGIKIWRGAANPVQIANDMPTHQGSSRRAFVRALLVQLANPKTAIFYASMFAAMLPASPPFWMLIVLPPLLFCIELVWYAIVAFAFSSRKPRSAYLHSKQWIDRAAGAGVGALGVKLLIEGMRAAR